MILNHLKFCRKEAENATREYENIPAQKNPSAIKLNTVESTARTNENENSHQQYCEISTNLRTVQISDTEYQNLNPYLTITYGTEK